MLVAFKGLVDVTHGLGGLGPERDERVLIHDEGVREHVAPGGRQEVNLLEDVQLQLVKTLLALFDMALDLREFWKRKEK